MPRNISRRSVQIGGKRAASAQTADVTFLTLPVSTTGKVPAAGRYNALAILRVEYQ